MGMDREMDDFNLAPQDVVYNGEPVVADAETTPADNGCASCTYFSCGWMFLVFCGLAVLGLCSSLVFFAVPPNWGLQFEALPVEYGEPLVVAGVVPGQYWALYQVDFAKVELDAELMTEVMEMNMCVRNFGNNNVRASAQLGFVPNVLFDPYANQEFEASFDEQSNMLADYQFWEGRTLPMCSSGNHVNLEICNKNQKLWVVVENTGKEEVPAPFELKMEYSTCEGDCVCYDELSYDSILVLLIVLFSMMFCSTAICTAVCCSWFCFTGRRSTEEEVAYVAVNQQLV